MFKRSVLAFCLLLCSAVLTQPAKADVTYLCEVWPRDSNHQPAVAEVRFLTGGEMRKIYNFHNVSDTESYAVILADGNYIKLLRLQATVLFMTSSFDTPSFKRLFEVKGRVEAESLRSTSEVWVLRAKDPSLAEDQWVDPRLNQTSGSKSRRKNRP